MPKLVNFFNRVEIDGIPYLKNEIKPILEKNGTITIRYCMASDQIQRRVERLYQTEFSTWTDVNNATYSSVVFLLNDLNLFLFEGIKEPLPVSPQDSIILGSLIIPFDQLSDVRRMNADLDGTSTNDFTTFVTSSGEYQVPSDRDYVVSITSFATDRRLSMSLGYADNAAGLNFVELIDETIMSPQNNYSNETEFIFIIPSSKFPIVNNTANITTGFVILQGIESATTGAAALSSVQSLQGSFNFIDKQEATNNLLRVRNDTASLVNITVGQVAITLLSENTLREGYSVSNTGLKNVLIRYKTAASDNNLDGYILEAGKTEIFHKSNWDGEISAIRSDTMGSQTSLIKCMEW